jgi:ABC-2 type transport system permease protein
MALTILQRIQARLDIPLNPLALHEMRSRMRSPRAYAVLTIYLSIVSGITVLIYLATSLSGSNGVNDSSRVGTALFYIVVGMQTLLVSFVSPSFTAGALSNERENGTYDLLRMTLLTSKQIVVAKMASSFGYTLLLVFATLPLLSLAFLLGGVELIQVFAALAVIVFSAFLFCSLGLYISSRTRTTLSAIILTYSITLGLVLGMSMLTLIALPILNDVIYGTSSAVKTSPLLATLIQIFMFSMMSVSPVSALVASESNLQESGHALTIVVNSLPGYSTGMTIPAPFLTLVILYLVCGVLLLWLTIRRINEPYDHAY